MTNTARRKPPVLVADRDDAVRRDLLDMVAAWGYPAREAADLDAVRTAGFRRDAAIVLLAVNLLGGESAGAIVAELKAALPQSNVIVLFDPDELTAAVEAIRQGAESCIPKPVEPGRLRRLVEGVLDEPEIRAAATGREADGQRESQMIGDSRALKRVRQMIAEVARTEFSVLIVGESGTGKELVARAVHAASRRRAAQFVAVNMAALPRDLAESVMFGHEKGAFSGAESARRGWCEAAHNGTLFLDEIGEMDIELQPKLLRFLQDGSVQRVGTTREKIVDVRVIAATNVDPLELIQSRRLREDIYYRLNMFQIKVPPLRERREDIPALARWFLQKAIRDGRKRIDGLSDGAIAGLQNYGWPGNVRELENVVRQAVVTTRGRWIDVTELPLHVIESHAGALPAGDSPCDENATGEFRLSRINQMERQAIIDTLIETGGNVAAAARLLGMGKATVYRKIKHYRIELQGWTRNVHRA